MLDSNGIKKNFLFYMLNIYNFMNLKTVCSCSSQSTGVVKLLISSTVHKANIK